MFFIAMKIMQNFKGHSYWTNLGIKKITIVLRIGKNNNKYYENQFYRSINLMIFIFMIKNLYINPVLKQLRAKNNVYSFDDNVLEKLMIFNNLNNSCKNYKLKCNL